MNAISQPYNTVDAASLSRHTAMITALARYIAMSGLPIYAQSLAKLDLVQLCIGTVLINQDFMISAFNNLSILHH